MEYLDGQTLAARLANGALPLEHALHVGIQIAAVRPRVRRRFREDASGALGAASEPSETPLRLRQVKVPRAFPSSDSLPPGYAGR